MSYLIERKVVAGATKFQNGLCGFGKILTLIMLFLNVIAIVACIPVGLVIKNWFFVGYMFGAGLGGIVTCLMILAVFSIHEELCGLRISQIKANEINDESLKYLRYMAKLLTDKSEK